DPVAALREPERNIQIGCWYLEKMQEQYRDVADVEVRMVAAYNAGPSRAAEWNKTDDGTVLSGPDFIRRIDIPSTRAYVISILDRYRNMKVGRGQTVSSPAR